MKFELLTEEDVKGENRLSIFKKLSPVALATDVVNSELKSTSSTSVPYWLDTFYKEYPKRPPFLWQEEAITRAKCIGKNGISYVESLDAQNIGVRLKISYDEIKDEIIKQALNDSPYIAQVENGVKVLLALEWPQEFVAEEQDKTNLYFLDSYGKLKKAGKIFDVSEGPKTAYFYKQNRYVNINGKWAKVLPLEWYYDEEAKLLVSKRVFFCSIMANFSNYYEFNFQKSVIAEFVHDKFEKEAIMDSAEKEFYSLPLALYNYQYADELKEILFWETRNERVKKRRSDLERLKAVLLEEGIAESTLIDEIIQLNEEDETLVERFAMPRYIAKAII